MRVDSRDIWGPGLQPHLHRHSLEVEKEDTSIPSLLPRRLAPKPGADDMITVPWESRIGEHIMLGSPRRWAPILTPPLIGSAP